MPLDDERNMVDPLFKSLEDLSERLLKRNYIVSPTTVAALFVATRLGWPLVLEGPAGAGKTVMAKVLSEAMHTELVRLQCYDGIKTEDAIGTFDHHLQYLYLRLLHQQEGKVPSPGQLAQMVYTPAFLIKGPILEAILRPQPVVLLIDEIDKVDGKFESALLEVLSDWTVSLPQLAKPIEAVSKPIVIITSNGYRELTEPLLRRCIYLWMDYPTPKEEVEILGLRAARPHPALDTQIAGHAVALRRYLLEKPPAVSEMLMLKEALALLGIEEIRAEHREVVLPLVIKKKKDRDKMTKMDHAFEDVLTDTNRCRDELARLRALEEWQKMSEGDGKDFERRIQAYERRLTELKNTASRTETAQKSAPLNRADFLIPVTIDTVETSRHGEANGDYKVS
jgi:MoxR-like ATPase